MCRLCYAFYVFRTVFNPFCWSAGRHSATNDDNFIKSTQTVTPQQWNHMEHRPFSGANRRKKVRLVASAEQCMSSVECGEYDFFARRIIICICWRGRTGASAKHPYVLMYAKLPISSQPTNTSTILAGIYFYFALDCPIALP